MLSRSRAPRDDARHSWTKHSHMKMTTYGVSESLVRRILRNPVREEEGVAEKTRAAMIPAGHAKRTHELWVMYRIIGPLKRIISVWRYPGVSPVGRPIAIPADALEALADDEV